MQKKTQKNFYLIVIITLKNLLWASARTGTGQPSRGVLDFQKYQYRGLEGLEMTPSEYRLRGEELIREHGTNSQIDRLNAGVLPDQEFDDTIRWLLFRNVRFWAKWRKIKPEHVRELAQMRGRTTQNYVKFETVEPDEFTDQEWSQLQNLKRIFPGAKDIAVYWVVATCGEHEQRWTKARIVLDFCGVAFHQELLLGAK
jgi:hypothetical protein